MYWKDKIKQSKLFLHHLIIKKAMTELGLECTDIQFKNQIDNETSDEGRVAVLVSELYTKSVRTAFENASDGLTVSQAYLGCIQMFFRNALESNNAARHFYNSMEDTCPYCANVHCSVLGLKLDSDVTTMLQNTVSIAEGVNKEMSLDAMVFVAKQASNVLVRSILAERSTACVGGSESCGKSILDLISDHAN